MAYPPYVLTRPVSVGGAMTLEGSDALRIKVTVTSTRNLVWDATGYRFESRPVAVISEVGTEAALTLPRTDVAGWRDGRTGALIDVSAPDSHTHTYNALVEFLTEGSQNAGIAPVKIGPFVLPAGDGSAIDLDKTVPVGTVTGQVLSIPDSWSLLVASAEAAAAEAAASLALVATPVVAATPTTVPLRGTGGTVKTAAPVEADDAARKADIPEVEESPLALADHPVNLVVVPGRGDGISAMCHTSSILTPGRDNGNNNVIGGDGSTTVGTTTPNVVDDAVSANVSVVGGYDCVAGAISSKIISDHSYTAIPTTGLGHNGIFGGQGHIAGPAAGHAGIIGGSRVQVNGLGSMGTGYDNTTHGDVSIIAGRDNLIAATGDGSAVFGETQNVSGPYGLVAGYDNETGTAARGVAVAGELNVATGPHSLVVGRGNTASGSFATAWGSGALADSTHAVAAGGGFWAAEPTRRGARQRTQYVVSRLSTDATIGNLGYLDAGSGVPIVPANTAWMFELHIVAVDITTRDTVLWNVTGGLKRIGTGASTLVGTPTVVKVAADAGAATWVATVEGHAGGGILVRTTGEAAKSIRWVGNLNVTQVGFPA